MLMVCVNASTISFIGTLIHISKGQVLREGSKGILGVKAMGKDDIHIGLLQAGQGALQPLDNVLLRETSCIGLLSASAKEHLTQSAYAHACPVFLNPSTFVLRTYSSLGQASSFNAFPISTSHSPFA